MQFLVASEHHRGASVPIQTLLRDFASQEGADGEEYDVMAKAAQYIDFLESLIPKNTNETPIQKDQKNG